ncbi:MAG: hypothetical protein ACXWOH_05840 [Bdellovibrionota bacterium]
MKARTIFISTTLALGAMSTLALGATTTPATPAPAAQPAPAAATNPAASAPLQAQETTTQTLPAKKPFGVQIRPSMGYAFFGPKALNSWMSEMNNTAANYKFNGAGNFGISADYTISSHFAAGVRMDYLFSQTDPVALNTGSGQITTQASFGALPLYLTGTFVQAPPAGWKIGTTFGAGISPVYHTWFDVTHTTDPGYPLGTLNFAATPFSMIGSAFISYDITKTVGLRFDTSYRYLSAPDIRTTSTYGSYQGGAALQDAASNGANVILDASSLLMTLGLVVNL